MHGRPVGLGGIVEDVALGIGDVDELDRRDGADPAARQVLLERSLFEGTRRAGVGGEGDLSASEVIGPAGEADENPWPASKMMVTSRGTLLEVLKLRQSVDGS